jgi:hypothetical protein
VIIARYQARRLVMTRKGPGRNRGQLPWEEMLPLTYPKRDSTIEVFNLFAANLREIRVNTVAQHDGRRSHSSLRVLRLHRAPDASLA